MYIRNKTVSALWKFVLVVVATYGLLDGTGILAGTYHAGFPHMFTNVSNIFAWGYFLVAAISGVDGVAFFIVAMIVAFIVLGYLIFAIDKILGRVANRK